MIHSHREDKTLILCGGLQSSGTTLISYCFLQRADTDGVLDAPTDLLPSLNAVGSLPFAWYKAKISCFRFVEIADYYRDAGWKIRPLLIVRDLRQVWASLRQKAYGCNGITAEDPPLRLRLRRFIDDWRHFKGNHLATLRYEDFVSSPISALRATCTQLNLAWDDQMLSWPKAPSQFADRDNGNETFWVTCGSGLLATVTKFQQRARKPSLPTSDLEWLETEFRDYNEENGYPVHLGDACFTTDEVTAQPAFEVTRRYDWETRRKPIRWVLSRLGWPNKKLIERRLWKRVG